MIIASFYKNTQGVSVITNTPCVFIKKYIYFTSKVIFKFTLNSSTSPLLSTVAL